MRALLQEMADKRKRKKGGSRRRGVITPFYSHHGLFIVAKHNQLLRGFSLGFFLCVPTHKKTSHMILKGNNVVLNPAGNFPPQILRLKHWCSYLSAAAAARRFAETRGRRKWNELMEDSHFLCRCSHLRVEESCFIGGLQPRKWSRAAACISKHRVSTRHVLFTASEKGGYQSSFF